MGLIRDPRYYEIGIPPARRLAVIAMEVVRAAKAKHPTGGADIADFEEAFAPMLDRELLSARVDQCSKNKASIDDEAHGIAERLIQLSQELPRNITTP